MIKQINYKTLLINGNKKVFQKRIRDYEFFESSQSIIIRFGAKEIDPEYEPTPLQQNVCCYDIEGNLKWTFPQGITGMAKKDENTVSLYDGSFDNHVNVVTGETVKCIFVK